MSARKVEQIYVDLDVVLDARLGTLARISEDTAERILNAGYHTRETDSFEGVDMDLYRDLYAKRDSVTLSKSVCSGAVPLLRHLAGELTKQAIGRPYHEGMRVVVNTHPYVLTSAETDEIGAAIAAWMQGLAEVTTLSCQPKDLTPSHCKSNFAMMLVYDFEAWMECHAKAFETTRLPEVTMFAPALYAQKPTDEELAKTVKEAAHPLRAIEWLASPIIDLKLIDVKYFSIITTRT